MCETFYLGQPDDQFNKDDDQINKDDDQIKKMIIKFTKMITMNADLDFLCKDDT